MIKFSELQLSDGPWVREQLSKANFKNCDYSFGNQFIWQEANQVSFANVSGFFCAAAGGEGDTPWQYNFPAGEGDIKPVIEALMADAAERGSVFRMRGMDEPTTKLVETLFPGVFSFETNRNYSDYIYSTQKLVTLAGKRLHGKRNHINRFKEADWSYEDINQDNIEACKEMNKEWCKLYNCYESVSLNHEACAVKRAFAHFFDLGFQGGMLRQDGRVVAYTIGEPLCSDTFVVHIEKAFPEVQGAYPMINQQFVEHNCQDFMYVNREEDMGDEGLRKAKLSYYPDILLDKYTAIPRTQL